MLTKLPMVMPRDLSGLTNGDLPARLLVPVGPAGVAHHLAARGFKALQMRCMAIGLPLTYTFGGCYRSRAQQRNLFVSRYEVGGRHGGCKAWDSNGDGRTETWCKKLVNGRVPATAAVPGTSNHGWALAFDVAFDTDPSDGLGPDDAAAITGHPQWRVFMGLVLECGFSWELDEEPWHIRWVVGDNIPQAVLDVERWLAGGGAGATDGTGPVAPAPAPVQPAVPVAPAAPADLRLRSKGDNKMFLMKTATDSTIWICDGIVKRRARSMDELNRLWFMKLTVMAPAGALVLTQAEIDSYPTVGG